MIILEYIITGLNYFRHFASLPVNIYGFQIPAVIIALFVITLIAFVLPKRKFQSWRVNGSKKWLIKFRKNKGKYSASQRFQYVRDVDYYLFEDVLMSCFEERGYPVQRTKLSWDEGSDGFVTINKTYMAVQAKRYSGRISKQHVKDLNALVQRKKKLKKGIFIHSGKSSEPILDYVKGNPDLDMISGVDRLINFLDGDDTYIFGFKLNGVRK